MLTSFGRTLLSLLLSIMTVFTSIGTVLLPKSDKPDTAVDGHVRIMSFNIDTKFVLKSSYSTPALIAKYRPDSVGLQECNVLWMSELRAQLPDYAYVGVGRDTGDRSLICGEMCAIMYRKDKYRLSDSGTFWLSETPEKPSRGWEAEYNRICTWVILESIATGKKYVHMNTHLDYSGDITREKSIELILGKAADFDLPVVITGDFNFHEGEPFYYQLVEGGLSDVKYLARDTMTGFTYFDRAPEEMTDDTPIDFIWVNNGITDVDTYKIVRDTVLGALPSDHYPVYSDMIIY